MFALRSFPRMGRGLYHNQWSGRQYSSTARLLNPLEAQQQEQLIRNPPRPYTELYKQEWKAVVGGDFKGVGDLVFKVPEKEKYLVVETKHLGDCSAKKKQTKCSKARKQARNYAGWFKALHPNASVEMAIHTEVHGVQKLQK